jgi:hypothetical protein
VSAGAQHDEPAVKAHGDALLVKQACRWLVVPIAHTISGGPEYTDLEDVSFDSSTPDGDWTLTPP